VSQTSLQALSQPDLVESCPWERQDGIAAVDPEGRGFAGANRVNGQCSPDNSLSGSPQATRSRRYIPESSATRIQRARTLSAPFPCLPVAAAAPAAVLSLGGPDYFVVRARAARRKRDLRRQRVAINPNVFLKIRHPERRRAKGVSARSVLVEPESKDLRCLNKG
jgi:hypothetical protein